MTPQQRYYRKNKERLLKESRERYAYNLESEQNRTRTYRLNNKEEIKERRRRRAKSQRKNNPLFRLKENISRRIRQVLKRNNFAKNGDSFLKYVSYTVQELKDHIEKQFEPWMNWNNQGVYNKNKWIDGDSSTWTWQLDHIVPHSKFKYISMDSVEFKKCWALENLRPLSAKVNFIRGINLLKVSKNVSM